MYAGRVKKTKMPESVPDAGDPERKRVLNVLAQRRYRRRQKEKIAKLEAQAKGVPSPLATTQESVDDDGEPQFESENSPVRYAASVYEDRSAVKEVPRNTDEAYFAKLDFDLATFPLEPMQNFNTFRHLPAPLLSPTLLPFTLDGALLPIPNLAVTRTFISIALTLNLIPQLYDPYHLHVLPALLPHSTAARQLPANLHPTFAQLTIPHHPMLDLLPWPSVRQKLICMLSLPSALRPVVAQEEEEEPGNTPRGMSIGGHGGGLGNYSSSILAGQRQSSAVVHLVHDLDDERDGCGLRVHGNTTTWSQGNEFVEDAWEVGELFFRKWWWCLDARVVEVSNALRAERGLGRLKMVP
ncbi:hypothetical protein EJ02DRAFT_434882 [Clathrospora elynae]|uniref:BZIP domain-containing protein n=1 Tax=Clathrospora elynae TaxID=706981 RepID=A0A6A5SRT7_9PLEO|nr:hypothetical protein EJ02DRAFT_434882 [Clathrospora elynae]